MESNLYFLDYQFSDIQRQRILPFLESHAEWIFYQIWFNFWLWLWLVIEMPGWFLLKHRTRLTVFSSFYFFPEIFIQSNNKCTFLGLKITKPHEFINDLNPQNRITSSLKWDWQIPSLVRLEVKDLKTRPKTSNAFPSLSNYTIRRSRSFDKANFFKNNYFQKEQLTITCNEKRRRMTY